MIKAGKRKLYSNNVRSCEWRCKGNYLKVLKRDDYSCRLCGDREFPMVHHLDGNLENNKINNLLTVCRRCHAEFHGFTIRINNPTFELIKELRQQQKTYQQIGDYLGISRQRVHQIINRAERDGMKINRRTRTQIIKDALLAKHQSNH